MRPAARRPTEAIAITLIIETLATANRDRIAGADRGGRLVKRLHQGNALARMLARNLVGPSAIALATVAVSAPFFRARGGIRCQVEFFIRLSKQHSAQLALRRTNPTSGAGAVTAVGETA